jgi:hypothetical protein
MLKGISTPEGLATAVGVVILGATVNANVIQTGGWFTSHALLVSALSAGVFAGARVVGAGAAGKIAAVIVVALTAGELFNFSATAERIVVERENGAAPLKAAMEKHSQAVTKLHQLESAPIKSERLSLALEAQKKAQAAYQLELRTGGRCKSICNGLKDDAAKADAEVTAAASEAQKLHTAAIEAAKADVAANPLPASATPLADRLGWAPWVLDLIIAGLLSFGSNVLAGVLIAFGARHPGSVRDGAISCAPLAPVSDHAQTDFDPVVADNVVRFFRPDQGGSSDRNDRPGPKKPGPTGPIGLSKAQALDDLMQRLADGRTIGSQDELAADWHRPKQTVSDWLREWRRIGVIPAPVKTGRCKSFVAG